MSFNLTDPAFLAQPDAQLAEMRARAPLVRARIPLLGELWVTTDDATAREVLKSPDLFVRDPVLAGGRDMARMFWWLPPFMRPLMQNMLAKDGADHKRLRGRVDHAFARHSIAEMRPELTRIADNLLDRINPDAPVNIISGFCRPLPLMAICVLLGVPPQDRDRIARWIAPISGPTNALTMLTAMPGLWRILRHFRADIAARRITPGGGLIDLLINSEGDGDPLNEDELLSMIFILFVAGHETTVHLIGNALHSVATQPDLRGRLAGDTGQLPIAIEEFLRFHSPVMMTKPMFVTRDVDFHGVPLSQGDKVMALLIAANHDPARFEAPDTLLSDRRPNAHLGFGFGPHVCLGMQLARLETEVALERLLDRFPDMALADPVTPPRRVRRTGMRGLAALNLRLRP